MRKYVRPISRIKSYIKNLRGVLKELREARSKQSATLDEEQGIVIQAGLTEHITELQELAMMHLVWDHNMEHVKDSIVPSMISGVRNLPHLSRISFWSQYTLARATIVNQMQANHCQLICKTQQIEEQLEKMTGKPWATALSEAATMPTFCLIFGCFIGLLKNRGLHTAIAFDYWTQFILAD